MVVVLFLLPWWYNRTTTVPSEKVSLDAISAFIENDKVEVAKLDDSKRRIELTLSDDKRVYAGYPDGYGKDLVESLRPNRVRIEVGEVTQPNVLLGLLFGFLPFLLVGVLIWSLSKRLSQGGLRGMAGNNKGQIAEVPETRFTDVAGCDEALEDLREVVEFLQEGARYERLGARVPSGVLLVGPPGTGKTMLARATAGEAGVPFFALSGSDFVEMFVGVGASRVRTLFEKARKAGRAIVFIDEIDAIGKKRGGGGFGGGANDERENTLNALLVEMDGFIQSGVVVIAATNRVDVLDAALLRPGRFDRRVMVGLPDRRGREKLYDMYLEQKTLEEGVKCHDLSVKLAKRSTGMSGADIAAVVNEAALGAAKRSNTGGVGEADLNEALERVALGRERRSAHISERAQRITAWHEAGHTTVSLMLEHASKPERVSIVPRGGAGGATWFAGDEDEHFQTRREACANLAVSYGGRAGEEILLEGDYTQGASGDIAQATRLAEHMVFEWGMSEYGLVRVEKDRLLERDDTAHRAVRELLEDAIQEARRVLFENHDILKAVAEALLENETLGRDELDEIKSSVLQKRSESGAHADT
jgi:cell division protease FtsH